jgi:low-density lipoprotein receptor-related protein 1 (alpha-2-macroglobulin receptor)
MDGSDELNCTTTKAPIVLPTPPPTAAPSRPSSAGRPSVPALCSLIGCTCPPGLFLNSNRSLCESRSTCEFGTCSQLCSPNNSTYECKCAPNYRLHDDGFECVPLNESVSYVLFSNRHEIRALELPTLSGSRPLIGDLRNAIALDFYWSDEAKYVFWSDVADDKLYRATFMINTPGLMNVHTIIDSGLGSAEGLAVDWLGRNVYWVASAVPQIDVAKLDGSSRATLIAGNMQQLRSIALDPNAGLLFWSDWQPTSPRIERATMAGDERRVIHLAPVGSWPNGLALDYELRRVFWLDAKLDCVQSATYDGDDVRVMLKAHELLSHPFALTLFGHHVYWTDWKTAQLVRADKFSGQHVEVLQRSMTQPFDVKVVSALRQPRPEAPADNPCYQNGNCSHLCLLLPAARHRCACPHLMRLQADRRTCESHDQVLLIAGPGQLRGVQTERPDLLGLPPLGAPHVLHSEQLDFVAARRLVFWADSQKNELKRIRLLDNQVETIMDWPLETPFGLAVDYVSGNLYVTSQQPFPVIYVCNQNGEFALELIRERLFKPFSLAVSPKHAKLFWTDHGGESVAAHNQTAESSYVAMANTDGSGLVVLVDHASNPDLIKPSSLTVDPYDDDFLTIFWVNVGSGTIQMFNVNSNKLSTIFDGGPDRPNAFQLAPYALCVNHTSIIFSSRRQQSLYSLDKPVGTASTNETVQLMPKLLRNQTQLVTALKLFDLSAQHGSNACSQSNGGCAHLCLPLPKKRRMCRCAIGFKEGAADPTKCVPINDAFVLCLTTSGLKGVHGESSTNQSQVRAAQLPPIVFTAGASLIDVNYDRSLIYWAHATDGIISRVNRDSSGHQTLVTGLKAITSLAIDWISGNLYWIDAGSDVLEVANSNGSRRIVLISSGLRHSHSLVLDLLSGLMFWADGEAPFVINKAKLDGSDRRVLYSSTSIETLRKLTVDLDRQSLYWLDSSSGQIVRIQYDGSARQLILTDARLQGATAFALHSNRLYWAAPAIESAIDTKSISSVLSSHNGFVGDLIERSSSIESERTDKQPVPHRLVDSVQASHARTSRLYQANLTRSHQPEVVDVRQTEEDVGELIRDLQLFARKRSTRANTCSVDNGGCAHLCLYTGDRKHRCECEYGLSSGDGKQCLPYDFFIAFARKNSIEFVHTLDADAVNAPFAPIRHSKLMRSVVALSFDWSSRRLFYSDVQTQSIASVSFDGTRQQVLADQLGSVEGLAFDFTTRHLYWSNGVDAVIGRLHVPLTQAESNSTNSTASSSPEVAFQVNKHANSSVERLLRLEASDRPRGLALDACVGMLFWTNWNSRMPSVQRASLKDLSVKTIVSDHIRMPNAIALDTARRLLFWADAKLDQIERCRYDGSGRQVLPAANPQHVFALAVTRKYVFWTDWLAHGVLRANELNGEDLRSLRKDVARPMGIVAVDEQTQQCVDSLITERPTAPPVEIQAQQSQTVRNVSSVKVESNCTSEQFKCTIGDCIPFELTCDGQQHCSDGSDERTDQCHTNRPCPPSFFSCDHGRCVRQSARCDGQADCADGKDELNCRCDPTEFRCESSGVCIPESQRCDQDPDCADASDEKGCPVVDCGAEFLNCRHTTACVHPEWLCDKHDDCWDNSDEIECGWDKKVKPVKNRDSKVTPNVRACVDDEFTCASGKCVPKSVRCDHVDDCGDSSLFTVKSSNKSSPSRSPKNSRSKNKSTSKRSKLMALSSDEQNCEWKCFEDQWRCASGECISSNWRCDGSVDCVDKSDERNCTAESCAPNHFRCANGSRCIPIESLCDGDPDCPDASDEAPTYKCPVITCKPTEFQCENGFCTKSANFCDGDDDCGDLSDEPDACEQFLRLMKENRQRANDLISTTERPSNACNASNQFTCNNGRCLSWQFVCDGHNQCGDFSDETRCNVNECESNHACAHLCEDLPIGYRCHCRVGYEPIDGGRECRDVNECEQLPPFCSHSCRNTRGSYRCSCAIGYTLSGNGRDCLLSNGTGSAQLLFSNRYAIRQSSLAGQAQGIRVGQLNNVIALDVDLRSGCVFWSSITQLGSSIGRQCSSVIGRQTLHSIQMQSPDGLAVDWVAGNLYWCDKGADTIEVSRQDGRYRRVLIREGLQEPRAIALHPFRGQMFWTDWGDQPYIGQASMDGSNVKRLIEQELGWPNALCIDFEGARLYWADAKLDYIGSSDLDGRRRVRIITRANSDHVQHVFALSVFEHKLFWSDWHSRSVATCDKRVCSNSSRLFQLNHRPMDVHVVHSTRQQLPAKDLCAERNCSALCLLHRSGNDTHPSAGARCACPNDFRLADDQRTCIAECGRTQFLCRKALKCIPSWWKCDTQDDCGDREDEPSDCPPFYCLPGQFQCDNQSCITAAQVCDGIPQCADKSDELYCGQ